ncbi:MAG: CBS domain-containing protein [Bacteroidota bacterium]
MHVAAILKEKGRAVETAKSETTLMEAARKLAAKRIGAVVVMDGDGGVAGILSERDIVRALATEGSASLDWPISEVMTRSVQACSETDTIDHVMSIMTARRFRHLPVVEDGALSGIVSIGDVVKHHIAEVEMEATAMRDYITTS